jgi:hypothetical protein
VTLRMWHWTPVCSHGGCRPDEEHPQCRHVNGIVSSCVICSCHRGLVVNLGQEGSFCNILFTDCIVETRHFARGWWGHGEPIYVSVGAWHAVVGRLRNVRFRNILARSENGAYIAADAPGLIEDAVLDGVRVVLDGVRVVLDGVRVGLDRWSGWAGGEYDRRPTSNGREVFAHRTAAIRIDTASDVTLRDCEVVWDARPDDFGYAVGALDVDGLVIEGSRGGRLTRRRLGPSTSAIEPTARSAIRSGSRRRPIVGDPTRGVLRT